MTPSLPLIRIGIVFGVIVTALLASGCAPAAPATATSSRGASLHDTRSRMARVTPMAASMDRRRS